MIWHDLTGKLEQQDKLGLTNRSCDDSTLFHTNHFYVNNTYRQLKKPNNMCLAF